MTKRKLEKLVENEFHCFCSVCGIKIETYISEKEVPKVYKIPRRNEKEKEFYETKRNKLLSSTEIKIEGSIQHYKCKECNILKSKSLKNLENTSKKILNLNYQFVKLKKQLQKVIIEFSERIDINIQVESKIFVYSCDYLEVSTRNWDYEYSNIIKKENISNIYPRGHKMKGRTGGNPRKLLTKSKTIKYSIEECYRILVSQFKFYQKVLEADTTLIQRKILIPYFKQLVSFNKLQQYHTNQKEMMRKNLKVIPNMNENVGWIKTNSLRNTDFYTSLIEGCLDFSWKSENKNEINRIEIKIINEIPNLIIYPLLDHTGDGHSMFKFNYEIVFTKNYMLHNFFNRKYATLFHALILANESKDNLKKIFPLYSQYCEEDVCEKLQVKITISNIVYFFR